MCSPRKSDEKFSILTFLWIKTNVAYTRLEVIAKQRSALQVEFITGVKLICYFVLYYCFLHWSHLPNMAVGDLAFYYTLYLCAHLGRPWLPGGHSNGKRGYQARSWTHNSTLITYFSGMKIDPKYAFLHAFFLICLSCSFQNLSIWPKTHPFFQFCTFLHP